MQYGSSSEYLLEDLQRVSIIPNYNQLHSKLWFPLAVTGADLKWVRVSVPQYRIPGDMALLQCDYNLGNDNLYAVKWYKDNEEFFKFLPKARPEASSYSVEGIHVDVSLIHFLILEH